MSVSFARAVADGLRHNGVVVHWIDGWERRGNGQTSDYQGMIWHHTASAYGSAYPMLWNGRAGLPGPLCNSSGNADGSVTIVAAHPANHAGASGGRSMGPLPVTRLFNKHAWGHEIVYPGTRPMTDAQYRSALILAGVISGILRRPTPEWVRGHAETSITGKWDPGYAEGRTYDLRMMRANVWGALHSDPIREELDFLMALDESKQQQIYEVIAQAYARTGRGLGDLLADVDDKLDEVLKLLQLPSLLEGDPHPGNLGNAVASVWRQTFFATDYGRALVDLVKRDAVDGDTPAAG